MDKSSTRIGVNPVSKVSPVMAAASIADPVQALESRASQLAKQHAGLVAKIAVLNVENPSEKPVSTTDVSATAKLIDRSLKQAEAKGLTGKYIAQSVITHNPKLPDVVSQQLRAAIGNSGLFYESHLSHFVDGHRNLAGVKLEPQNQFSHMAQTLLPQQLYILEHQRLSWHGEVWPGQQMDWEVYRQNQQKNNKNNPHRTPNAGKSIASDLTLYLPLLGKVVVKINLQAEDMHISLYVEREKSLQLLKEKSASLVNAIEARDQTLKGLTLEALESDQA